MANDKVVRMGFQPCVSCNLLTKRRESNIFQENQVSARFLGSFCYAKDSEEESIDEPEEFIPPPPSMALASSARVG